ncbi:cytochrome c [Psychrobium sp. MM17-31]|uniref:c-type cytochrome n=1 Tax=Psychrobium sp. MM17-31 TaxID=2917758 RepID=UPI001EF5BA6A|nr:cytochrome c [Psychrobium sp. MM17-31]MCG7531893.1 cytochrome c [Psychrobium sp. MM17-31]
MSAMKKVVLGVTAALLTSTAAMSTATAAEARSEKHAKQATELRQSVFKLLASNIGPMGAMARGKMPMDKAVVEKNATRINQLSMMITDYMATDTRKFNVSTEALASNWTKPELLAEKANALTMASANLMKVVKSGDEKAIKKAIGGIGRTCGGCHDDFKKD